jgi:hypothetical protein
MRSRIAVFFAVTTLLGGCANPVNQVTEERYTDQCVEAESVNALPAAEMACARALANVSMGNLSKTEESQDLYNLGRIKRRLSKFSEAEQLQRQSLEIETALSGNTSVQSGRRLVELSVNLAAQDKWDEAVATIERARPMFGLFNAQERDFVKGAYQHYGAHYSSNGNPGKGAELVNAANSLGP